MSDDFEDACCVKVTLLGCTASIMRCHCNQVVVVVVLVVVVVVVEMVVVVVVVVVVIMVSSSSSSSPSPAKGFASPSPHVSASVLRSDTLRSFCEVSLWLMVVWSTYASSSEQ